MHVCMYATYTHTHKHTHTHTHTHIHTYKHKYGAPDGLPIKTEDAVALGQ